MPPSCFRRAGVKLAVMLAVAAVAGCGVNPSRGVGRKLPSGELVVNISIAAASDLQAVLPILAREFSAETPSIEIDPSYGASGQLANQIEQGAPFDLFLSADLKIVQKLVASKSVDEGSVSSYAIGALALVANRQSGALIAALDDLKRPEIKKVAIANPETAPYGAAAKQTLMQAGLWDVLQPKIVIAGSVGQALQYVQSGNAEAGIVGRASADVPEVKIVAIDRSLHAPIVQGLGIVSRSTNKDAAKQFAAYLLSPQGQAVLVSFGFRPPVRDPAQ